MTAAAALQPTIEFRQATTADEAFIFDSWLRSQWKLDAREKMPSTIFFAGQRQRIDRLLPRSRVIIAYSPADATEALGYVVAEASWKTACVHWLYVKSTFRRLGIASRLLQVTLAMCNASNLQHSHKSDARAKRLFERVGSTFNPYAAE